MEPVEWENNQSSISDQSADVSSCMRAELSVRPCSLSRFPAGPSIRLALSRFPAFCLFGLIWKNIDD